MPPSVIIPIRLHAKPPHFIRPCLTAGAATPREAINRLEGQVVLAPICCALALNGRGSAQLANRPQAPAKIAVYVRKLRTGANLMAKGKETVLSYYVAAASAE